MSAIAPWHRRTGTTGWVAPGQDLSRPVASGPLASRPVASRPVAARPVVGLACRQDVYDSYIDPCDVERLETVAELRFQPFDVASGLSGPAPRDAFAESALAEFSSDLDVLVVCHGSPYVSAEVLDASPRLSLLGELEGDRFGYHFDTDAAAAHGVPIVDTTHGSSWPTAEWALGLALVGLRNAGAHFRRLIAHEETSPVGPRAGYERAELSHKRVGMLGFGHLGRHLTRLLGPFEVDVVAYDPFPPRELAEAYGIVFGPLEAALRADVVFCLLPLTPRTHGLLGRDQLGLLLPGAVFVNVSRGTCRRQRSVARAAAARRRRRLPGRVRPRAHPPCIGGTGPGQRLSVPPPGRRQRGKPAPLLRFDGRRVPAVLRRVRTLRCAHSFDPRSS